MYGSSNVATDKKGYTGPVGCGFECEANVTCVKKKQLIVKKLDSYCKKIRETYFYIGT